MWSWTTVNWIFQFYTEMYAPHDTHSVPPKLFCWCQVQWRIVPCHQWWHQSLEKLLFWIVLPRISQLSQGYALLPHVAKCFGPTLLVLKCWRQYQVFIWPMWRCISGLTLQTDLPNREQENSDTQVPPRGWRQGWRCRGCWTVRATYATTCFRACHQMLTMTQQRCTASTPDLPYKVSGWASDLGENWTEASRWRPPDGEKLHEKR